MPGHADFPPALVHTLDQRIATWFVPMYGYGEEEELGLLEPAALKGKCAEDVHRLLEWKSA